MKEKFIISNIFGYTLPLILLLVSVAVAEEALVQVSEKGRINWSTRIAMVKGVGTRVTTDESPSDASPSDGLGAARINARANLLDTISTIRISSNSRIADRMAKSPGFSDGLIALVQNADITHQEYFSDGTVEIEMTMKLSGGFAQFVLPEDIQQVDSITATTGVTKNKNDSGMANDDASLYTGLIIDAIGIGAEPSMVPLIVDESGETVYGPAFVSRELAVSRGMSGFAPSMNAARQDKRVGQKPMIVKAIRTHLTGNTDLVISNADAARLRSSVVYLNFLKACQVTIAMDVAAGASSIAANETDKKEMP